MNKNKDNILKMVDMAMLTALSVVLMLLVRFPLIPSASFLEYDMGDVAVLIATFLFGTLPGLAVLFAVSLLQALTVSAASGWVGFVMHFFASGLFLLAANLVFRRKKDIKHMVIGLLAGSLLMTAAMIPLNLIFTVHFLGSPFQVVKDMLLPAIIPFNLLKALLNSLVSGLLYFPVVKILTKSKLLPRNVQDAP